MFAVDRYVGVGGGMMSTCDAQPTCGTEVSRAFASDAVAIADVTRPATERALFVDVRDVVIVSSGTNSAAESRDRKDIVVTLKAKCDADHACARWARVMRWSMWCGVGVQRGIRRSTERCERRCAMRDVRRGCFTTAVGIGASGNRSTRASPHAVVANSRRACGTRRGLPHDASDTASAGNTWST